MASTISEIEELISQSVDAGYRGRLSERGLARSVLWDKGQLPEGSPQFSETLTYDTLSYGYSLLSLALRLKELGGNEDIATKGLEKAANAISNLVIKDAPALSDASFHRLMAASGFHLARFSAKAYSLLAEGLDDAAITEMELSLSLLVLRRLDQLDTQISNWKTSGRGSDQALASRVVGNIDSQGIGDQDVGLVDISVISDAITDSYISSIHEFIFALESGDREMMNSAIKRIDDGLDACSEMSFLREWWILRVTKYFLNDLWNSSFHHVLPVVLENSVDDNWNKLRWLFIASLFKRSKSEVELWPSQLEGAQRAINEADDLVVSLPTSAGKTRIAELCILRCLALGKRVLFITPLRALSAQTEASLRKTFTPLGKTISTLYGSIGTSDFEQDVLRTADIVVGTPEKLDFALRNDSSLIDDVGLIVLDEGHMIGLGEREVRYEVQIQRLLKRPDAASRRVVCLSAILPDGEQLKDFTNWLRQDKEGEAVRSNWRPTDIRFGEVVWQGDSATLNFIIGDERPFIRKYVIGQVPPTGKRKTSFPKDKKELVLATAWRLVKDSHTVLIYCPAKRSVNSLAKAVIDLHKRGALRSVLDIPIERLHVAIALGQEWLGDNHPVIECLRLGVAIHHGSLPTPYRKEVEKLLREGVLKVTVSSPTLAQGLNLTATTVIFHSLTRGPQSSIDQAEFKNVIGRAGRAFVDTHGVILYPIFDKVSYHQQLWNSFISSNAARDMESGLLKLVSFFLLRIAKSIGSNDLVPILEYLLGNSKFSFPVVDGEDAERSSFRQNEWSYNLIKLDTALLSMIGNEGVSENDIPEALDRALDSSLFQRRLGRLDKTVHNLFSQVLKGRAEYIWGSSTAAQRKGYFLAGVGLETGLMLDGIAAEANLLLVQANAYLYQSDDENAIKSITELAAIVFAIPPFAPKKLPVNWPLILKAWLSGDLISSGTFSDMESVREFIEDAMVYRLPWGLEAIRVRAVANEDKFADNTVITDYETGLIVPAIETGTLNRSAALLIQAGFSSRAAAIKAVSDTSATFTGSEGLKVWLVSDLVQQRSQNLGWPSTESRAIWEEFSSGFVPLADQVWTRRDTVLSVVWSSGYSPEAGEKVRLHGDGGTQILSSTGELLGWLSSKIELSKNGVYSSHISDDTNFLEVTFWGGCAEPFRN